MTYTLRPYQQEIVDFALPRLSSSQKPLLVNLGTGGGKTWVISELAKKWGENVLVLTISKELCEQDYEKLKLVAGEENVGMYSASWNKKEIKLITVATIQSAYKHPELWEDHRLLILDECDNIPVSGMLASLLKGKQVFGLTATPYATQGSKYGRWFITKLFPLHKIKDKSLGWFWQPVEFNISEKELQEAGYLCQMKLFSSPLRCNLLKLNSNGSEYVMSSVDEWIKGIYNRILAVMKGAEKTQMCKNCGIVFMPSVESCEILEKMCEQQGISAKAISYKTPTKERDKIVEAHKTGKLKWIINQNVCSRGFDNPAVDCLVIARPTRSLRLHRQILGRGLRISEGKTICNVFDLTENCRLWGGPADVEMGKNGWQDTILLRGKDISGMELSKINLANARKKNSPRPPLESLTNISRRKNK